MEGVSQSVTKAIVGGRGTDERSKQNRRAWTGGDCQLFMGSNLDHVIESKKSRVEKKIEYPGEASGDPG